MPGIFVSYRRDDSQGFAGRLADDLLEKFGTEQVFRDIEIPVGSDFTDVLHRAIAASDVLLVVIGRNWAGVSNQGLESRLFEPTDWVRTEIEAAFAQGKRVIPVLVGGATMVAADSLPPSIRRLNGLQAASMSDRHWDAEIEELAQRLRELCPSLASEPSAAARAEESPADVLRELGGRILDEVAARRRPRLEPPHLPPTFVQQLLAGLWRMARKALSVAVVVALVYGGLRLFGDASMQRSLDTAEARIQVAWQRLQARLTER